MHIDKIVGWENAVLDLLTIKKQAQVIQRTEERVASLEAQVDLLEVDLNSLRGLVHELALR